MPYVTFPHIGYVETRIPQSTSVTKIIVSAITSTIFSLGGLKNQRPSSPLTNNHGATSPETIANNAPPQLA